MDNILLVHYHGFYSGSGSYDRTIGSGETIVYHTAAKNITCSFSGEIHWTISGVFIREMSASCTLSLPQLTVNPTLPNSISVSGGQGGYISKDNPIFNVSWSGAKAGTFTISRYSIDVSKNNWSSSYNADNVYTSAGSGSKNNVNFSGIGLSGGETIRVRVGMMTTNGTWWGHTYWSGTFKVYSLPSAPSTFNVPATQEIDTAFNVSWSGATAGSEGISKYQLQRRVYNGSSWGDWTTVLDKNATSYSSPSPRSITGSTSESYQIQFRIRIFDGKYGYSSWSTKTLKIKINSPTAPRKQECFRK